MPCNNPKKYIFFSNQLYTSVLKILMMISFNDFTFTDNNNIDHVETQSAQYRFLKHKRLHKFSYNGIKEFFSVSHNFVELAFYSLYFNIF